MTKMENCFKNGKVRSQCHSYQTIRPYLRSCRSVACFHYLQWLLCVIVLSIYLHLSSGNETENSDGCPAKAGTAGSCPDEVNELCKKKLSLRIYPLDTYATVH